MTNPHAVSTQHNAATHATSPDANIQRQNSDEHGRATVSMRPVPGVSRMLQGGSASEAFRSSAPKPRNPAASDQEAAQQPRASECAPIAPPSHPIDGKTHCPACFKSLKILTISHHAKNTCPLRNTITEEQHAQINAMYRQAMRLYMRRRSGTTAQSAPQKTPCSAVIIERTLTIPDDWKPPERPSATTAQAIGKTQSRVESLPSVCRTSSARAPVSPNATAHAGDTHVQITRPSKQSKRAPTTPSLYTPPMTACAAPFGPGGVPILAQSHSIPSAGSSSPSLPISHSNLLPVLTNAVRRGSAPRRGRPPGASKYRRKQMDAQPVLRDMRYAEIVLETPELEEQKGRTQPHNTAAHSTVRAPSSLAQVKWTNEPVDPSVLGCTTDACLPSLSRPPGIAGSAHNQAQTQGAYTGDTVSVQPEAPSVLPGPVRLPVRGRPRRSQPAIDVPSSYPSTTLQPAPSTQPVATSHGMHIPALRQTTSPPLGRQALPSARDIRIDSHGASHSEVLVPNGASGAHGKRRTAVGAHAMVSTEAPSAASDAVARDYLPTWPVRHGPASSTPESVRYGSTPADPIGGFAGQARAMPVASAFPPESHGASSGVLEKRVHQSISSVDAPMAASSPRTHPTHPRIIPSTWFGERAGTLATPVVPVAQDRHARLRVGDSLSHGSTKPRYSVDNLMRESRIVESPARRGDPLLAQSLGGNNPGRSGSLHGIDPLTKGTVGPEASSRPDESRESSAEGSLQSKSSIDKPVECLCSGLAKTGPRAAAATRSPDQDIDRSDDANALVTGDPKAGFAKRTRPAWPDPNEWSRKSPREVGIAVRKHAELTRLELKFPLTFQSMRCSYDLPASPNTLNT